MVRLTSPLTSSILVFVTFTAKRKSSPSRTKRGGFGSHMSGLVVVMSSFLKIPPLSSLSCATMRSFQPVSASGTVKVNETLPSASVSRSGKKNAVSFRFVRGGALKLGLQSASDPNVDDEASARSFAAGAAAGSNAAQSPSMAPVPPAAQHFIS